MRIETKTIHSGYHAEGPNRPVTPPLQMSTIWTHPEGGFDGSPGSFGYQRYGNPNRSEIETILATLEGGSVCTTFSSGMAAITAVFQALDPGDHVIVCNDVYHGTRNILNGIMHRWGLKTSYVDVTDPAIVEDALTSKTRLIWLESPSNPMLLISDIREITRRVRGSGVPDAPVKVCVDNTWATPVLQRPIELGADLVMHSVTKYIGGHSDILAGAIILKEKDDFSDRIQVTQKQIGAVISPFESWMLVRSVKTLVARMRMHCENARQIADHLNKHPRILKVYFPGLPDAQGHEVAKSQMSDFGGMISFLIDGKKEQIMQGITRARLISVATSLGGVESLWEHRQSSEGPLSATPPNLVRLSVGIEHVDDLIEDIDLVLGGI
ncbi:MAG TPA: cystathionine gamma-synthase [Bacteroidetes bacterium]|nr:cystathionine gamma-synthase [Bacteroidota bacterium]